MKIEFKRKYSLQNGRQLTKKNWQNVIAKSNKPCVSVYGFPAIEKAKKTEGVYYETWKLSYEKNIDPQRSGYIFREVNHNGGISGFHKTPKLAVFHAMYANHISVFLEETPGSF